MPDLGRFAVFIIIASVVFLAVVLLIIRPRMRRPNRSALLGLTIVVVPCGMLFARYGHILFGLPWWIYYGAPALVTFLLPPLALKMNRAETARYLPLAVLMAPSIHVLASLFLGWHDYMPFPVYIPSLREIFQRLAA